jgi:hypothetical protein
MAKKTNDAGYVQDINRELMNTVRNADRDITYAHKFEGPLDWQDKVWGIKPRKSGETPNLGQAASGIKALNRSIKKQSKAAKKASKKASK